MRLAWTFCFFMQAENTHAKHQSPQKYRLIRLCGYKKEPSLTL